MGNGESPVKGAAILHSKRRSHRLCLRVPYRGPQERELQRVAAVDGNAQVAAAVFEGFVNGERVDEQNIAGPKIELAPR